MPRPTNKIELIDAAQKMFASLWGTIQSMPPQAWEIEFDFIGDPKKTEAHWGRDKNLRDILIHLYEWHQLLIQWIESNSKGQNRPFLPEPYNWKTYGDMNVELWRKHQKTTLQEAESLLKQSHLDVLALVQKFSDKELFTKKFFNWTGTTTLGSYCVSALSSHYDWAIKKMKAHRKVV